MPDLIMTYEDSPGELGMWTKESSDSIGILPLDCITTISELSYRASAAAVQFWTSVQTWMLPDWTMGLDLGSTYHKDQTDY
jgi:hypothetical protein